MDSSKGGLSVSLAPNRVRVPGFEKLGTPSRMQWEKGTFPKTVFGGEDKRFL